jgi:hypothetical protein
MMRTPPTGPKLPAPDHTHSEAPVAEGAVLPSAETVAGTIAALLATGSTLRGATVLLLDSGLPVRDVVLATILTAKRGSDPKASLKAMAEAGELFHYRDKPDEWLDPSGTQAEFQAMGIHPLSLAACAAHSASRFADIVEEILRSLGAEAPYRGFQGWRMDHRGWMRWGGAAFGARGTGPHAVPDCLPIGGTLVAGESPDTPAGTPFTLPGRLLSGGELTLRGLGGFTTTPPGLWVNGWLHLEACPDLVTLGPGLSASALMLRGCDRWDGRIPADATLDDVFTDRHPNGLSFWRWRKRHPNGERA